jgi:DNA-binding winged helix-turn-helix (wHTH) protein
MRFYELRRSGRVVKLERIPMELLLLLVVRKGELVTRDQIVERIWGKDAFLDADNSINGAIRKIRQVLKDDPDSWLRCHRCLLPGGTPTNAGSSRALSSPA